MTASFNNTVLQDVRLYRQDRLHMNNPKGWAHVQRRLKAAIKAGHYAQHNRADRQDAVYIVYRLARLEASTTETWQDYVPDFDEPEWYDDRGVRFTGEPSAAQVEAARRFVTRWLHYNDPEFTIPGSEWGQSLVHWIQTLVAAAEPKEQP